MGKTRLKAHFLQIQQKIQAFFLKKAVAARLKFPGLTGIEKKFLKEESLILEDRLTFMNDHLALSKKSKSSSKLRK